MNIKQSIISLFILLSTATSSFAQNQETNAASSTKTRAEVAGELKQADANGSATSSGFLGTDKAAPAQAAYVINRGKTRSEMIAELEQAEKDGTLQVASFAGFRNPASGALNNVTAESLAHK